MDFDDPDIMDKKMTLKSLPSNFSTLAREGKKRYNPKDKGGIPMKREDVRKMRQQSFMDTYAGMTEEQAYQIDKIANKREYALEKEHLQTIMDSEDQIDEYEQESTDEDNQQRNLSKQEKASIFDKRMSKKALVSHEKKILAEKCSQAKEFLLNAGD